MRKVGVSVKGRVEEASITIQFTKINIFKSSFEENNDTCKDNDDVQLEMQNKMIHVKHTFLPLASTEENFARN